MPAGLMHTCILHGTQIVVPIYNHSCALHCPGVYMCFSLKLSETHKVAGAHKGMEAQTNTKLQTCVPHGLQ